MTETPPPGSSATAPTDTDDIASLTFDKALDQLRDVVSQLEDGGLTLEDSIALYERGAALHEHCGTLLDKAELRVQRLVDSAAGPRVMDLRPDDEDEL